MPIEVRPSTDPALPGTPTPQVNALEIPSAKWAWVLAIVGAILAAVASLFYFSNAPGYSGERLPLESGHVLTEAQVRSVATVEDEDSAAAGCVVTMDWSADGASGQIAEQYNTHYSECDRSVGELVPIQIRDVTKLAAEGSSSTQWSIDRYPEFRVESQVKQLTFLALGAMLPGVVALILTYRARRSIRRAVGQGTALRAAPVAGTEVAGFVLTGIGAGLFILATIVCFFSLLSDGAVPRQIPPRFTASTTATIESISSDPANHGVCTPVLRYVVDGDEHVEASAGPGLGEWCDLAPGPTVAVTYNPAVPTTVAPADTGPTDDSAFKGSVAQLSAALIFLLPGYALLAIGGSRQLLRHRVAAAN